MKAKDKSQQELTFTSPFSLEAAASRLKNVTKRGIQLDLKKVNEDVMEFQLVSRHRIGIVFGQLRRDDNQTMVSYQITRGWSGSLMFGLGNVYGILFTVGVPMLLWYGLSGIETNTPIETVFYFGGALVALGWLVSRWRYVLREQHIIAQILYGALRDPIPDVPNIKPL
jgi:hypothetical protein